jgi:LacI family transcriptional regulator
MKTPKVSSGKTPDLKLGREVTLQDVAQAVQVSTATVSMVLNNKGRVSAQTRERVKRVARDLGFVPNPAAQRLSTGYQDNTIALFSLYLDLNVITRKLQLLQDFLAESGFDAPIYACSTAERFKSQDQAKKMKDLLRLRPRAVACQSAVGFAQPVLDEIAAFIDQGGTVVCYDSPCDLECDQVLLDREHNTYLATRHLLELGHRNIGFSLGYRDHEPNRLHGLRRALKEFGAPVLDEWLTHELVDSHVKGGASLAEFFLRQKNRPTAMCIVNDYVATGFVSHLLRNGLRVPEDVSVIGHDNMPIAEFGPTVPLTSVSNPIEKTTQKVSHLLLERLSGEYAGPPRRITVQGELIIRASTGVLK